VRHDSLRRRWGRMTRRGEAVRDSATFLTSKRRRAVASSPAATERTSKHANQD
jgi:hypothetical protein